MYHHMSSWFWLFGPLMMLVWIAILGIVVYLAVRLANDHNHAPRR